MVVVVVVVFVVGVVVGAASAGLAVAHLAAYASVGLHRSIDFDLLRDCHLVA